MTPVPMEVRIRESPNNHYCMIVADGRGARGEAGDLCGRRPRSVRVLRER
jgi:hypothetical protein